MTIYATMLMFPDAAEILRHESLCVNSLGGGLNLFLSNRICGPFSKNSGTVRFIQPVYFIPKKRGKTLPLGTTRLNKGI